MSGLVAFVVHEAFEVIVHVARLASLTPMSTVAPVTPEAVGSSFTGPDMTTRFAPASKWAFDPS